MNNPINTRYIKYIVTSFVILLMFSLGFLLGKADFTDLDLNPFENNRSVENENYEITGDLTGEKVKVDADLLWQVWNDIENVHIDSRDIDKQEMLYSAIDGIVRYLDDDYSQFLTPEENKSYETSSSGQFEGIGAYLRFDGQFTVIETPISGFPAENAGIVSGDIILQVDDEDVEGKGASEVADLIRGPADTEVKLLIFRPSEEEEKEFSITRQEIDIENIVVEEIDESKAVIKLFRFNESNQSEFRRQWNTAVDQVVDNNIDNVIIDLRNNPGGVVSYVQFVTEEFLKEGDLIMKEEDAAGNIEEFRSTRNGRLNEKNIVVLVNQGSASASEILTGALQDNGVAEVVGKPTLGKGVEQRVINYDNGASLQVVFKKWLTPNGTNLNNDNPIKPDYDVDLTEEDYQNGRDPQLQKAFEVLNIQ